MSGSDDRVRTARSRLLRAVESLGNESTRPLETNSENTSPQLQLANHDASGGRGVQREPAYESAAISTPTSKATTSAVAERNRRPKDRNLLALCSTWSHDFVCLWSTTTTKPSSCLEIEKTNSLYNSRCCSLRGRFNGMDFLYIYRNTMQFYH